ncbi:MAG: hypothetical protein K0S11_1334 [Gammaproteobacteria bacterium]|jgi:hypothetical protein|nr:hypothetical protein [Gammaproteobacteria bacterium]
MSNESFYNKNTYKAMIFKPNDYLSSVLKDENFLGRLEKFQQELQEKKAKKQEEQPVVQVTQVSKSSKKKKRRKAKQALPVELPPSPQIEIKTSQKAVPCRYNSLNDLKEMLSEIIFPQLPLNEIKVKYEQALIQLQRHKDLLTTQQYINYSTNIRQQLNLLKTKPGLYYIQRASINETQLDKNNLNTAAWSAVISDYEKGIKDLIPADKNEHNTKKLTLYKLITFYQHLKDFAKSIDCCTQLISSYPKEAKAYYQRAISHALNNQFLPAMTDFDKALDYKANFPKNEAINYEKELEKLLLQLEAIKKEHEQNIQQLAYPGL